eukprot:2091211-Amphidinium_carterae.1
MWPIRSPTCGTNRADLWRRLPVASIDYFGSGLVILETSKGSEQGVPTLTSHKHWVTELNLEDSSNEDLKEETKFEPHQTASMVRPIFRRFISSHHIAPQYLVVGGAE